MAATTATATPTPHVHYASPTPAGLWGWINSRTEDIDALVRGLHGARRYFS